MVKVNIKPELIEEHEEDAYEELYENFTASVKGSKLIGITSCIAKEGKSHMTLQLGLSLAEHGNKVLLIDGDLNKPSLQTHTEAGEELKGLLEVLAGEEKIVDVISATNIRRCHFLFRGQNPVQDAQLDHQQLCNLLNLLKNVYDYIIMDLPVLQTEEVYHLTSMCDGILLVIESGMLDDDTVMECTEKLYRSKTPVLGAVLNFVE